MIAVVLALAVGLLLSVATSAALVWLEYRRVERAERYAGKRRAP